MARIRGPVYNIDNNKKKTDQGNGTYSRKPHAGGETFHNGTCAGSTPSKARRRKKTLSRPRTMSTREQELRDLKEKYDLLILAVHDMNDLIHELRDENRTLKRIIEVFQDG